MQACALSLLLFTGASQFALVGVLGVVVVLYLGLAVATIGVLGSGKPSSVPLAELMQAGLGAPGRTATAVLAVLLCLYAAAVPNITGVVALVAVSFCLSLMFPTIYGVALKGLGPATKFGAAGLVMAIVGGAIMPLVQGATLDATSPAFSFVVPAACFIVVAAFAFYDLRAKEQPPVATSRAGAE